MKNKILSPIVAGLMVISLVPYFSASFAYADDEHENEHNNQAQMSQVVQFNPHEDHDNGQGHAYGRIKNANKDKNDDGDDNENEDEDKNEHNGSGNSGNSSGTPGQVSALQALIQQLSQLVAQLEAQLLALIGSAHAPVISAISATNISSTSATIVWTTDTLSKSKVYYSTTSPVDISSAPSSSDSTFVKSHSINLTGLSASTTYYYIVESVDSANNISRGAQASFITLAVADNTAPVISAISVSNVSSTSSQINWTTNELATSQVFYATSSPVNIATASTTLNNTLVASHSISLTGLTASTTIFFVVQSKDVLNNTATSTQQSFTTTQ